MTAVNGGLDANPKRRATAGSWKKGQCGNPNGRPPKPMWQRRRRSAETAQEYAEKYTKAAFSLLGEAVIDKDTPMAARVSAAKEILDRRYGRAPQDVTVRGSVEHHIISLLKAFDNQDVKQIEGEATEVLPESSEQGEQS